MLLGVDGVCIISHGSSAGHRRSSVGGRAWSGRRGRRRLVDRLARTGRSGLSRGERSRSGLELYPVLWARPGRCRRNSGLWRRRACRNPRGRGPLGRQEVFELVRDRLADILEIEPGSISESSSFAEDLDADSLALIELVEAPRGGARRAHRRLPHRRRGSRRSAHRARRRRLRRRQVRSGLTRERTRRSGRRRSWRAAPAAPLTVLSPRARRRGESTPVPVTSRRQLRSTDALRRWHARLDWEFEDAACSSRRLSHRSWCAEAAGSSSERAPRVPR